MFDGNFRKGVDAFTKPVGKSLSKAGVTADMLTTAGVLLSIACCAVIASGHLYFGWLLLGAAALPDLFDGPVAKASGKSSVRGEFFDSVADRVTDSFVLLGIAWYLLNHHHGTAVLLPLALLGSTQWLSYMRAKAEIHGFNAKGGLMERGERIVVLLIGLAFNRWLVEILWFMLVLTLITVFTRFAKVWRQATNASAVHVQ